MHCHSTQSDGTMTVQELKKAYMKKGYSIIAFTDHEHLIDNSYLNDDKFLAITSCEIAIKEFKNKSTLVKKDMKVCHLNLYSLNEHNIDTPCYNLEYDHFRKNIDDSTIVIKPSFEREYSHSGISEIIKIANKDGFLVSYNHPGWSLEDARDYLGYKGLWAMEIFNNASWEKGIFDYNPSVYDEFLRDGNTIACIAGDDNHKEKQCFSGFTMINADVLEYDSIMSALKNHNFYSSTGAIINELYVEDNVFYISVKNAKYVTMSTGTRRGKKQYVKRHNEKLAFEIFPEDKYVRFDVEDKKGNRANTNAYFIENTFCK